MKRKKRKERGERRSTYQRLWKSDLREIVKDYKTLLFSNFQKKKMCFVRVMSF